MEAFENVTQILTALASLSAVIVAILAFWRYRDLRPTAQLKRRQDEHMNNLASHIMQILDRQQTFRDAQLKGFAVDPYMFPAASREAEQLNELLDECSRLHLIRYCVGEDRDHRWALYGAFRAAVTEQAELDTDAAIVEDYTKQHFVMGMTRIASLCLEYDGLVFEDLTAWQRGVPRDGHELAWNYLGW